MNDTPFGAEGAGRWGEWVQRSVLYVVQFFGSELFTKMQVKVSADYYIPYFSVKYNKKRAVNRKESAIWLKTRAGR
jgi:hypothetical protein